MTLFRPLTPDARRARRALRDRLFRHAARTRAGRALSVHEAARREERYEPSLWLNLIGVGLGERVTDGDRTGELCLKVYVARKFPAGEVPDDERVPDSVEGLPTDVEGIGYPERHALTPRKRHRPVIGGVSIGLDASVFATPNAGTLGVVVRAGSVRLGLSNNHVLANENEAARGAAVVQPGTFDGGDYADRVGALEDFEPLRFGNRRNTMDAAVARFDDAVAVEAFIAGIGVPAGAASIRLGSAVRKMGRTTALTEGLVRAVAFDARNIRYEHGLVRMDDVFVVVGTAGAFSRPGDSGAAVVDHGGRVVGLLFAGSDQATFVIPIARVLRRFGAKVAG